MKNINKKSLFMRDMYLLFFMNITIISLKGKSEKKQKITDCFFKRSNKKCIFSFTKSSKNYLNKSE